MRTEDLSDNPTTASLETLIGTELLGRLSAELGARRVYIPANPGPNSPIAACIGLDAARKISQVYAGMEVHIPTRPGLRPLIVKHWREGMPKSRIAAHLRVSRTFVQRVLNAEDAANQPDLFK